MPVSAKKERNGLANAKQGLLQLAKTAAIRMACRNFPYLSASTKRIAPTDCMHPKLYDEYARHQLLKG